MIKLSDTKDNQCKFFLDSSHPKNSQSKVCGQHVASLAKGWVYASYCKDHVKLVVSTPPQRKTEVDTNANRANTSG